MERESVYNAIELCGKEPASCSWCGAAYTGATLLPITLKHRQYCDMMDDDEHSSRVIYIKYAIIECDVYMLFRHAYWSSIYESSLWIYDDCSKYI